MNKSGKKYKIAGTLLVGGMIMAVVGYFFYTILIPLQDVDLITREELLELQRELAINYPLGKAMMIIGGIGLLMVLGLYIIFLIQYVYKFICNYIKNE